MEDNNQEEYDDEFDQLSNNEDQYNKSNNNSIHRESKEIDDKLNVSLTNDGIRSKIVKRAIPQNYDKSIDDISSSSINLDNFDPFNTSIKINSPRSLDVCFSNGVDPRSLYHKSYEEIKSNI